ncbi:hypothetical protein ACIQTU_03910 [Brevundimonas sp. NPDC090276]|uniref:hypothetical protein n=1 Tax=Brevundimonas sp. NPDC090276 TaxID=3363956 RepID=UPI00383B363B
MSAARTLLHQWTSRRVEGAVRAGGLTVDLSGLERWLLDQKPGSLAEAERLLDVIATFETGGGQDLDSLCQVGGAVRNDLNGHRSRVDVSFAPCASGPMAGRA